MTVFGDDYDTRDGSCIRDYIHVSDIANAHYLAVEYMMTKMENNFDVFNLGSENGISVLELINEFERVNGVKVNYKIGQRREGDVIKIYSDSTKAKSKLGWSTNKTIEDMVSSAWKWHKNKGQK
jgi:UDP-glucose 4-epimerase